MTLRRVVCQVDGCETGFQPESVAQAVNVAKAGGWVVIEYDGEPWEFYCPEHSPSEDQPDQDTQAMAIFLKSRTAPEQPGRTQWDVYLDSYRMIRNRIDQGLYS